MKKKIALLMVTLLLCLNISVDNAYAATCTSGHSNYQDNVINAAYWSGAHRIGTGFFVGATEITVICNISYSTYQHSVTCGVCHTVMTTYYEPTHESHSRSHS